MDRFANQNSGPITIEGDRFAGTPKVSVTPPITVPKADKFKAENEQFDLEADKANSFWGLTKNFLKGIPKGFATVGKNLYQGIKEPVVNPNEQQKQYEEKYFPKPTNKFVATITKPGQTTARYITRFLAPALQPLANDIAEIKAINEKGGIADQVSSGKIPASTLSEFAVLQKTAPQIVGDVAQAVLSAYAGGQAESLLSKSVKTGFKEAIKKGATSGLVTGELFGGAQALSSGSKNPLEILSMIGTSGAAGGILGGIISGAIPVSKDVLGKVREAKVIYDSLSPLEKQGGFIKNPFKTKELNVIADHIDETKVSKEEFLRQINEPGPDNIDITGELKTLLDQEGITPEEFYNRTVESKPPMQEKIDTIAQEFTKEEIPLEKVKEKVPQYEEITPKEKKFNAEKYVKELTTKREQARKSGANTLLNKTKKFLANAKSKLVDFTAPIEDILSEAMKKEAKKSGGDLVGYKLSPERDIHNQIDRALRSPTIAGEFARKNGLVDVIKQVDNIDNLDQYLTAKHAIELDTRGIETGRNLKLDKALVKEFKDKYEPYAKVVADYSKAILDYSVESGLISKELADLLKKRYPDYVPFNRVFNEIEKNNYEGGQGGVASLSKQDVVQKIEGSTREVESPLESLLAKTNDAFKQGEKNKAGKILASYEDIPDNPFQLRELKNGEAPQKGMGTISFFEDGKKKVYETLPEVAQAAKSLNVQTLNILQKILAFPVRVARIGITGINLPFVAANIAKDQLTAFINSKHSLATSMANPGNFVKALFSAVSHDKLYREVIEAGGGGTSFDLSRSQAPKTISKIRSERDIKSRVLYTVKNPSQLLRALEDIVAVSEETTRLQQYIGTKKSLIKKGVSEASAKIEGARAYRENTINFARRGEWGTVMNSTVLYLNAGIQGTRAFLRNLKERPVATTTKIAIGAFLPVAISTAWNLGSPERKKAYEDIGEYEKENNIIVVPPNPTKDENGKWNVIKIPLSQEIVHLVGLVRRPIEQAKGLAPLEFKDFAKALIGSVEPISPDKGSILSTVTPQAIKPTLESAFNKNLFTGFPIVPDSMKNLSPKMQVKAKTSGSARKIGELLNVSPLKVEAFIKGTFGGVGPQALNIVDQVLAGLGAIPESQIGGQDVLHAITARFSKAGGGELEQRDIEEIQKLITGQSDKSALLKNQSEQKWEELKALPKEEAAKAFAELVKENPMLAKKITDIATEEKKGLTTTDRFIKQLQVTNGERARYIADKFAELDTKEEKAKLWQEYVTKGLISAEVAKQLSTILKKVDN